MEVIRTFKHAYQVEVFGDTGCWFDLVIAENGDEAHNDFNLLNK